MSTANQPMDLVQATDRAAVQTTLLGVITTVAGVTSSDDELVAVIDHLFASGRMKLVGEFTERDFEL